VKLQDDKMGKLIVYEIPVLSQPSLIIGFDGWPNAAGVSTGVVTYLIRKLRAKKFAEVEPWDFYVLTSSRPITSIDGGRVETFAVPASDFYYWSSGKAKDAIFLLAREPDMHWKEYAELVFQVLKDYGGKRIYTVGGVNDYVPHTREVMVSAVVSDSKLKGELAGYGVEFIDYKGPASIHTFFSAAARENMEVVSLWGRAPIYITQNPMVYYAVLRRLVALLKLDIDLEDMKNAARVTQEQVSEQIAQSSELIDLVKRLEEAYDKQVRVELPESGDIIKAVEEWLQHQRKDGG
jgi:proteasome assembly chaperone (PAC2) family protein